MVRERPVAGRGQNDVLMAVAGLALLVITGVMVRHGTVSPAERSVFHWINDLPDWLYRILWPFQQFGNVVVALLAALVVAAVVRNWKVAAAAVAAVVLKLGIEDVVKRLVERQRPGTAIGDVHLRGDVAAHGLSFVSGHAVITAALAGVISPVLSGRWKLVPWAVVVLNGFTRIYVGAHNPLDIVGGVGAGLLIAGILNTVLRPAGASTSGRAVHAGGAR